MHDIKRILIPLIFLAIIIGVGGWYFNQYRLESTDTAIQASGTIEAIEVIVSPEQIGKAAEILVNQGDRVNVGDPLFSLEDDLLQAQRKKVVKALEAANATVNTAQTGLDMAQASVRSARFAVEAAQVQFEITRNAARMAELPARSTSWGEDTPDDFSLPVWYYQDSEEIQAAEAEVASSRDALDIELANFESLLDKASYSDFREAEKRLARARSAYLVAQFVLNQAIANNNPDLENSAQSNFDAAQAELEASQSEYDSYLSDSASEEIMEARARLTVAQKRYETAQDQLNKLQTGEEALQVTAAEIALRQAHSEVNRAAVGVTQAEAAIDQANTLVAQTEAELALIDLQMDKLVINAPVAGVIIESTIEPGEIIRPGTTALTIGRLDKLTINVYITEERYGQINLGMPAIVEVDSFPGQTFKASVIRIADRAEFTPRNVQTEEGRRTTVFAVELSLENPEGKLKPGMPADVTFTQ